MEVKVYKIAEYPGPSSPLIVDNLATVAEVMGSLDDEVVGNKYLIEIVEMDKEHFDNLEEWGGF